MITARRSGVARSAAAGLMVAVLVALSSPADASAAVADPGSPEPGECRVACGLVFGLTSFTVATGSVVTWSRITGGLSSPSQGTAIWAISFGASLAAGVTVYGPRRERMVFGSGIGAVTGALVGFTLESLVGPGERSTKLAAALIGAAAGAVAGGTYGALSYESDARAAALLASQRTPLLALRLSF